MIHIRQVKCTLAVSSLILSTLVAYHIFFTDVSPGNIVLDYPASVNLGLHELQEPVQHGIQFHNRTSTVLTIANIGSRNCGCIGLAQEVQGKKYRVTSITIPPKSSAELFVIISGRPYTLEKQSRYTIEFTTTNARLENGKIDVTVDNKIAGIICNPAVVNFGVVRQNDNIEKTVLLYSSLSTRALDFHIESSNPNLIVASKESKSPDIANDIFAKQHHLRLFASINVRLIPGKIGEFSETITVYAKQDKVDPVVVQLYGKITGDYVVQPANVVLPRRSTSELLWDMTLVCRSHTKEPFSVQLLSSPEGVEFSAGQCSEDGVCMLKIKLDPRLATTDKSWRSKVSNDAIRLKISNGSISEVVIVPFVKNDGALQ